MTSQPVAADARPRSRFHAADITVTVILLVLSLLALVLFAILCVLIDFLGADNPSGTAEVLAFAVDVFVAAAVVAVVGTAISIILMVRRRRAWLVALGTLLVVFAAGFAAFAYYSGVLG